MKYFKNAKLLRSEVFFLRKCCESLRLNYFKIICHARLVVHIVFVGRIMRYCRISAIGISQVINPPVSNTGGLSLIKIHG